MQPNDDAVADILHVDHFATLATRARHRIKSELNSLLSAAQQDGIAISQRLTLDERSALDRAVVAMIEANQGLHIFEKLSTPTERTPTPRRPAR